MGIVQLMAAAILAAVLALMLKKDNPQFAIVITIGASALILLAVMPGLAGTLGILKRVAETAAGFGHYTTILKLIGIAYAAEFGAQICTDAGEASIASKLELAGKVMMMAIAAPLVLELAEQVLGLMP